MLICKAMDRFVFVLNCYYYSSMRMCVIPGSCIYSIKYQHYLCQIFASYMTISPQSPWIKLLEHICINYGRGNTSCGEFAWEPVPKVFGLVVTLPVTDVVNIAPPVPPAVFDRNMLAVILTSWLVGPMDAAPVTTTQVIHHKTTIRERLTAVTCNFHNVCTCKQMCLYY